MRLFFDIRTGKRVFGIEPGNGDTGPESVLRGGTLPVEIFFVKALGSGLVPESGERWEAGFLAADAAGTLPTPIVVSGSYYPNDGVTNKQIVIPEVTVDPGADPVLTDEAWPFADIKVVRFAVALDDVVIAAQIGQKPSLSCSFDMSWTANGNRHTFQHGLVVLNTATL